ncbi:Wzt carbohydrate-binding domain-containing protein, partial [Anaerolinea sp.]|uniref:Wzt carbohydrate-binding domain-containing protein n=1 Tax=Anaerolinea sp. TaxID=1872519 RepID=UPI002ACD2688
LVTHDVQTVRTLCDRAMWLSHGEMRMLGSPMEVTSQYIQMLFEAQQQQASPASVPAPSESDPQGWVVLKAHPDLVRWGNGRARIEAYRMHSSTGFASTLEYGDTVEISLRVRALADLPQKAYGAGINLRNLKGLDIITATTCDEGLAFPALRAGQAVEVTFRFQNILAPGDYALVMNVEDRQDAVPAYEDYIENAVFLKVVSNKPVLSVVLPHVETRIDELAR